MTNIRELSEGAWILLIIGGFYAYEGIYWLRTGSLAFRSYWGEKPRPVYEGRIFGNDHGGLILASPLPFATLFFSERWPISVSPAGAYAYVSQTLSSRGRPPQSNAFVRFEDMQRIEKKQNEVRISGSHFVSAESDALATMIVKELVDLSQQTASGRETGIACLLARLTSVSHVQERLGAFRNATRVLRIVCTLFFLAVFGGGALLVWDSTQSLVPPPVRWVYFVACSILWFYTGGLYFTAHARLLPERRQERKRQVAMMVFSPAMAMRAFQLLSKELLVGSHYVTIAIAVCCQQELGMLGRKTVRDLQFPMIPVCPDDAAPEAVATEASGPAATKSLLR